MTIEEWFEDKLDETVRMLLRSEEFIAECSAHLMRDEAFCKQFIQAAVRNFDEIATEQFYDGLAAGLAEHISMSRLAAAVAKEMGPEAVSEKLLEEATESVDVDYEALAASVIRRLGDQSRP